MDKFKMKLANILEAALVWFTFGLQVIPVVPGTKKPAVKWDPWLDNLNEQTIIDHWGKYPDHELASIVGPEVVVFDMDSEEASTAMLSIMQRHNASRLLVVKRGRGSPCYFRFANGVATNGD